MTVKKEVDFSLRSDAVELFKHQSLMPLFEREYKVENTKLSTHAR